MKRYYYIIVMTLFICIQAGAIDNQQTIVLKNGTELSGYIQRQDANGNITFYSESAIVVLNGNDITITNEKNYRLSELNEAWISWAEENGAFSGSGNNRSLLLCDVNTKEKSVTKVRVLEKGITVKYIELSSNTYHVEWKDVVAITGNRRPNNVLSGINRVYKLNNGVEFEGEFAEETDSTLSLFLANGMIQSFKIDDVVKYTYRTINPDQSLFEQCELLDIVRTKDGETKGIIIEQNYITNKDSVNYLLLQQENGSINSFKISDIIETKRELNPKYAPKFDILLDDDEIVINRMETESIGVKENGDFLVLDSLSNKVVIDREKNDMVNVTLEYKDISNSNVEKYKLVKVIRSVVKKRPVYYFSYRDLVNTDYRPVNMETSINHTTKVEYKFIVNKDGNNIFAFYDPKSKRAIPFIIK